MTKDKKHTAIELITFIKNNKICVINDNEITINNNKIKFDIENNKFSIPNLKGHDHSRIFDLTKYENHSVVMLLIDLFKKGYSSSSIYLEKTWKSGRSTSDALDMMLCNPKNGDIFMIEAKTFDQLKQYYSDGSYEKTMMQLISYIMHQTKNTKIASFYAYNFEEKKPVFNNIFCQDILKDVADENDFYTKWNKVFNHDNYIESNPIWGTNAAIKKYSNLQDITNSDTKNLYSHFLTILRLNSISDKPNAFMKVINLFLCKVADEIKQDRNFSITDENGSVHNVNGLMFQYIDGIDTPESFMKRLNDLYKIGMKKYLGKDIIEYSDDDVNRILNKNKTLQITTMIDDLRLKREHNFAFIEVYNDDTFYENFLIVKDIVRLLENYRFKYETRYSFLGDFFEDLLNTSLKQEAGQFFTPYPIVDFMVKTCGINQFIENKIKNNDEDFIPSIIDYACGAGHFLISSMGEINEILKSLKDTDFKTKNQKANWKSYIEVPYSFATKDKIVGIEKDYRLAKTTKISTFLNGDGDATIIAGDGINKFNCVEYQNTILHSNRNSINKFDFLISNPPYSVEGFMQSFRKNKIDKDSNTFTLLDKDLNTKSKDIETYFVERAYQLLKDGGFASIVLPQSILSQEKYILMRKFILENFKIKMMLLTADITFSGTTTSPVILLLEKAKPESLDYDVLIIKSPKYMNPTGSKLKRLEESFLGYSFSSNRAKPGIHIIDNSILSSLIDDANSFIQNGDKTINSKYCNITKMSNILLNISELNPGDIYPKYIKSLGEPLSSYCKINGWTEDDVKPKGYLEIGDMDKQNPTKNKTSKRFCKKGDILLSSLCPTSAKIVIAKDDFMLTNAIHVLHGFKSEEIKMKVLNALKKQDSLDQMNSLLDGFKTTYSKITEQNLYNNILLKIK